MEVLGLQPLVVPSQEQAAAAPAPSESPESNLADSSAVASVQSGPAGEEDGLERESSDVILDYANLPGSTKGRGHGPHRALSKRIGRSTKKRGVLMSYLAEKLWEGEAGSRLLEEVTKKAPLPHDAAQLPQYLEEHLDELRHVTERWTMSAVRALDENIHSNHVDRILQVRLPIKHHECIGLAATLIIHLPEELS